MSANAGLQSKTLEYRWGVVDASEPSDIRLVRGYVTVLEQQSSPADSPVVAYKLMFFDADGRPLTAFPFDVFLLMTCAGALAMAEVVEEAVPPDSGPAPIAALVPLAT